MPNSKSYKPPKSVKEGQPSIPLRPRSTRVKTERVRYVIPKGPSKATLRQKIREQTWTVGDRDKLYTGLTELGTRRCEEIEIKSKTPQQIRDFINTQKKNSRLMTVVTPDDGVGGEGEVITVRKKIDNPIEHWIALTENVKSTAAIPSHLKKVPSSIDCSHALPEILELIATKEKHPPPDKCNGVDYKEIYLALAEFMKGEVPRDLNVASSRKMMEMIWLLRNNVKQTEEVLKHERALLQKYSWRDISSLNETLTPSATKDLPMIALCQTLGMNPLNLNPQLFSKEVLLKHKNSI